jgi:hypothetical protein
VGEGSRHIDVLINDLVIVGLGVITFPDTIF